jgi:WD40-like Beta Propeller Repeat
MTLDSLANSAATAMHRRIEGRDLDADLIRLRRASHRRTRTQIVTCIVAVIILATGWLALRPGRPAAVPARPHPTPSPAHLHANGPIMGFANGVPASGPGGTSLCRVVAIDPLTGKATRQAAPAPGPCDISLAWSPDGRDLAELTQSGQISVRTPAGAPSAFLATCVNCTGLSWSPDGRTLASGSPDGILLIDASTGTTRRLLAGTYVWNPSWSPDGTRIAYAHADAPLKLSLDVVGVDGRGQRTLMPAAGHDGLVLQVAWSPNGRQIAVLALGAKKGAQTWPVRILSVDPRDGSVTMLHDSGGTCYCVGASPSISWAPDGRALAAWMPIRPVDGGWTLYTMLPDGSGLRAVPGDRLMVFTWWRAAG